MDIDIYLSFHIYIHTISYIPEYSTVYRLQGIPSQTAESTRFCPSRSMQYAPVTVSIPYRAGSFSCIQTSKAPPNNFSHFSPSLLDSLQPQLLCCVIYLPHFLLQRIGHRLLFFNLDSFSPSPVHRSPSCSVPCCPGRHRGPPFAPLLLSQPSRVPSLFLLRPSCAPQNGVTQLKLVCPWLGPWWMDARPALWRRLR